MLFSAGSSIDTENECSQICEDSCWMYVLYVPQYRVLPVVKAASCEEGTVYCINAIDTRGYQGYKKPVDASSGNSTVNEPSKSGRYTISVLAVVRQNIRWMAVRGFYYIYGAECVTVLSIIVEGLTYHVTLL